MASTRFESYQLLHVGTLVYAAAVNNEEALYHRTVDVCQTNRDYLVNFQPMPRSMT
jgi:hypothetical protein